MSEAITGKELVSFSGWDIDSVTWDELDRFDLAEAIEFYSQQVNEIGRQMLFVGLDMAKPEPSLEPPDFKEIVKISGDFLPDCVGKYEAPGPNRRKFKRNARRQRK